VSEAESEGIVLFSLFSPSIVVVSVTFWAVVFPVFDTAYVIV
jgi:hypothetical protein